jgi:hypothetical protein
MPETSAEWPHSDDDDYSGEDFSEAFARADYFVCMCGSDQGFTLQLGGARHGSIKCNACQAVYN